MHQKIGKQNSYFLNKQENTQSYVKRQTAHSQHDHYLQSRGYQRGVNLLFHAEKLKTQVKLIHKHVYLNTEILKQTFLYTTPLN